MTPLEQAQREISRLLTLLEEREETIRELRQQVRVEAERAVVDALRLHATLTDQEAHLVALLYSARGRPLRKGFINDNLPTHKWGGRSDRCVDVWVNRIRIKLGKSTVVSIIGGAVALSPFGVEQVERALSGEQTHPPVEEPAPRRILSDEQVSEICAARGKATGKSVAAKYRIHPATVYAIWTDRRRRNVAGATPAGSGSRNLTTGTVGSA